jgi:hypothetical protein
MPHCTAVVGMQVSFEPWRSHFTCSRRALKQGVDPTVCHFHIVYSPPGRSVSHPYPNSS